MRCERLSPPCDLALVAPFWRHSLTKRTVSLGRSRQRSSSLRSASVILAGAGQPPSLEKLLQHPSSSCRPVRLAGSGRASAARPGSAQTKRPPDRPTVFSLAVGVDALDLL